MKKISCRVAEVAEYDKVLELIRECYYKEEQITISHPDSGHTADDEEFTMSHIYHGTVTVAIDDETGKIIGALIAGPIEHGDAEKMLESAKTCETKKWSDIQKLLVYIEVKADVLGKFNLEKALHCHALGVDKEYRGNKIGQKMFRHCFENAKKLNYKLVSADFTSIYSIKIAEELEMEFLSMVTYDEYNKSIVLTISLSLGYRIMAPTSFKNLLKALKNKMKKHKSTFPRCSEIAITNEDKIRWQKLLEKCNDYPLIENETQPPMFDEN